MNFLYYLVFHYLVDLCRDPNNLIVTYTNTTNQVASSSCKYDPYYSWASCLCISIGILFFLFHAYVVFSFNFDVDYHKQPIQYLFVWLSIYEAISCLSFTSSVLIQWLDLSFNAYLRQQRFLYSFLTLSENLLSLIDVQSAYLVALLLALNRYFSIVKFKMYYFLFTKQKIRLYFFFIILIKLVIQVFAHFFRRLLKNVFGVESEFTRQVSNPGLNIY